MPTSSRPGTTSSRNVRACAFDQLGHPLADGGELVGRAHAVGRRAGDAGRHLVLEPGDAHHEELVEVLAEDGEELGPLEQRHLGILGQREDPRVEVEPRQLAVQEPQVGVASGAGSAGSDSRTSDEVLDLTGHHPNA